MMNILCVIPARLGSTRLPKKMLAIINGHPLIQRTYLAAKTCPAFSKVIVATDSTDIAAAVAEVGGEAMMTPADIKTGSDRVAFAAKEYSDMDIVINLQGDEPFVTADILNDLIQPYLSGEAPSMATLGYTLDFPDEYNDPNVVKVIHDAQGYAIYFSRSPIPYFRQEIADAPILHHMGLYAYQRDFLLEFTQWPQGLLEKAEKLEQLRAIERGYKIRVTKTEYRTLEINYAADLERAQQF